jgi:hypothetical protein
MNRRDRRVQLATCGETGVRGEMESDWVQGVPRSRWCDWIAVDFSSSRLPSGFFFRVLKRVGWDLTS